MPEVLELAGPVLVGRDDERARAWVVGGRLTFDRPTAPGTGITVIEGWVLPGLVDAHAHVGLGAQGAVDRETQLAQAEAERDVGALLLRDAGSPADTRWIDERDDLPVVIRAGRHIARSKRYIRNYAHEIEPEELVGHVRQEARRGDGWVKLVGDWIDRDRGELGPCWPAGVLVEAIAAAHQEGARVTAHCFGTECLPDLLAAGIDCLEHATGLDDATRALAAANGTAIVPTLVNIATFPKIAAPAAEKFPDYVAQMTALHAGRYANVRAAHEAGVPVFCGTDAGGSLPHGLVAQEVAELRTAGLSDLDALDAAAWSAREWLGRPGLVEGAPADLVTYPADPRMDVGVLAAPMAIVLRGKAFKPGPAPRTNPAS
jgi:imidazolonepropionase-like amidohydrolase